MIFHNQKNTASRLGISISTLEKFRRENIGPAYHRIGNKIFYSEVDLNNYLEKCRVESKQIQT